MAVTIKIDRERCKGCELCVNVCKRGAIKTSKPNKTNKMGYRFARVINSKKCAGCANCAIICPDCCIEIEKGD